MTKRRVVVTGVGLLSPIGNSMKETTAALLTGRHGIDIAPEWGEWSGIEARLCAKVPPYEVGKYTRKQMRTMGTVAKMALSATHAAVADAGLDDALLRSGKVGLAYGSTDGSTSSSQGYYEKLYQTKSFVGLQSAMYLQFMSHTCAANISMILGITGRVTPICSACTSASQSIGYGYEMIAHGLEDIMICGGAEEAHHTVAGVFDLMLAESVAYNDAPDKSPRPFDTHRDGMVVGEGAGTLVLETYERAKARGANIYAEIIGYGTNCDGGHLTSPSDTGMAGAMRRALADARISNADVDYVNAHGTGTEKGDIAESRATAEIIGEAVPISSTKSYTGHTLGGCGAIESAYIFGMFAESFLPHTRNLDTVDPRCAPLNYLTGEPRSAKPSIIMNNNFAFGGINTSLLYKRVQGA